MFKVVTCNVVFVSESAFLSPFTGFIVFGIVLAEGSYPVLHLRRSDPFNSYPHAAHLCCMGLQTLRHDCFHPTWPRAFYFPEPVLLVPNLNKMTFVPAVVLTQIELNSLICMCVFRPLIDDLRHMP